MPYRISSTVMEFVENRLIAWAHFGKHRWRYELELVEDRAATEVALLRWSIEGRGSSR